MREKNETMGDGHTFAWLCRNHVICYVDTLHVKFTRALTHTSRSQCQSSNVAAVRVVNFVQITNLISTVFVFFPIHSATHERHLWETSIIHAQLSIQTPRESWLMGVVFLSCLARHNRSYMCIWCTLTIYECTQAHYTTLLKP